MKERPILFSGPMVRALLDGTKTQTRRIVKCDHEITGLGNAEQWARGLAGNACYGRPITEADIKEKTTQLAGRIHPVILKDGTIVSLRCPYGQPGDRLWVRETWIWHGSMHGRNGPIEIYLTYAADGKRVRIPAKGDEKFPEHPPRRDGEIYSLRDAPSDFQYNGENTYVDRLTRWWSRKIPAIHMPRWASRITLDVTGVRMERLHDISEADAIAEGCIAKLAEEAPAVDQARQDYMDIWESINGHGSWEANPLVWVVEFNRVLP